MVLLADRGMSPASVAAELGTTSVTVRKWLKRWREGGLAELEDHHSTGRPREVSGSNRARILALTRTSPPDELGISHWSSYAMADYLARHENIRVSHNFVSVLWRENGLTPHRIGTHKLSRDPDFAVKVIDICGLYIDPPAGAVVLSVDEKTQVQALDRTQPLLPMSFGRSEQRTHDYVRHGTINLFAALDVATGTVTTTCTGRKRHQEFLAFMDAVAAEIPAGTPIHVVLDNLATHKGEPVDTWLERHPHVHFHYTPTGSSWMNQIEIWFNIITKQAIRRGTFSSVAHLIKTINNYTASWNATSQPFAWVATADDIIRKVAVLESDFRKFLANNNF